eukprot:107152-Ditylum_brightwellii.AAC.1
MWFLLPFLLLRKLPDQSKIRARLLDAILARRIHHWSLGQWHLLIRDYKADVIHKENVEPYWPPSEDERVFKTVTITLKQLSCNKCLRARKLPRSCGLSKIIDDSVLEQLQAKHQKQKQGIPNLTTEQMASPRQGILPDHLQTAIKELPSDVASGLGGTATSTLPQF